MDTDVDTDVDTTIIIQDSEDTIYTSSPIDIIDLTKESPKNRPSQSYTENASTSYHITRPRRTAHKRVLPPLVLGRRQNIPVNLVMRSEMYCDSTSDNEIVNLDTIEHNRNNEKEAGKQNKNDKQEADKYYAFESDNKDNKMPVPLTCPICFETLSSSLQPITTRCGHVFCTKCLKKSYKTRKHCPTCTATITLKSCVRLYL